MEFLILIFIALAILLFSISVHESAHAWMADKLGDPTARHLGRISLDPRDHIDPIGTILFPLLAFILRFPILGWAKPTPFNPWNLQNPKRDSALISFAGPASNFIIAAIIALPFRFDILPFFMDALRYIYSPDAFFLLNPLEKTGLLLSFMLLLNVILGLFNLIPIHPLDGFKVVGGLLPRELYYQWVSLERFGPLLLLTLIFFGGRIIAGVLIPLLNLIVNLLVG